jgi:hypothetical protein
MMMIMEQLVEWGLAGETEVLGENLPQCHLSTTNPTWPDLWSNLGRRSAKPATNRLSYGTAFKTLLLLYNEDSSHIEHNSHFPIKRNPPVQIPHHPAYSLDLASWDMLFPPMMVYLQVNLKALKKPLMHMNRILQQYKEMSGTSDSGVDTGRTSKISLLDYPCLKSSCSCLYI